MVNGIKRMTAAMGRAFRFIFFSDLFRPVILPVVYVNAIGGLLLLVISVFVDYEEVYRKLPFSEVLEYQLALLFVILLFEVTFVLVLVMRYARRDRHAAQLVHRLLAGGENDKVEFKSSLRWDYKTGSVSRELEYVVGKTVAAFLNSEGGTLLIGVDDGGNVVGIEHDYGTLKKKNADGFLLHLTNVVSRYLGKEFHHFVNISIEEVSGKAVCLIQVRPARTPAYLNRDGHQEFFIRATASSQPLEMADAHAYIKHHWRQ